jgi:hypothetical protein
MYTHKLVVIYSYKENADWSKYYAYAKIVIESRSEESLCLAIE